MRIYKRIIILSCICLCVFGLIGCSKSNSSKNLLSLGINIELPQKMKFGYSESKVFKYEDVTIPSVVSQCMDKNNTITFTSFPFTINDYKDHFKSAFSGTNIKEIKYDYEEVKIKNDNIEKVYRSKAILNVEGKKRYSYVYLVSFKNSSGTLIVETISKKDNDFKDMIKSLKQINSSVGDIELKDNNNEISKKEVSIVEDITIEMPADYTIKKTSSSTQYFINGFGNNEAMYVVASKRKPISTNNLIWNNINGYEVLKKYDDNNYLVHDYNTQLLYYLNTEVKEVKSTTGNTYYLRIEKLNIVNK